MMGFELSPTDKEKIRGFLADREEKFPFPQNVRQQYEWWIDAISEYVYLLHTKQWEKRGMLRESISKVKDFISDINLYLDDEIK